MLRGHRRKSRHLAVPMALGALLLAAVAGIIGVRLYLASSYEGRVAVETAKRQLSDEEAKRSATREEAKRTLPAEASSLRDWTLESTAEALNCLRSSDLKVLQLLVTHYLSRYDTNLQRISLDQVRTHVQAALESKSATPFETELAGHLDSEPEIYRCAYRYLDVFGPLRQAEKALDAGVFAIPAGPSRTSMTPYALAPLAALRGYGALGAGEPREALAAVLHSYGFLQAGWDPNNFTTVFMLQCADYVLAEIANTVWPDAPFTEAERKECLAAIGWRPSPEQIRQTLYLWVGKDPDTYYGPPTAVQDTRDLVLRVLRPLRNAGIYDRARELTPLFGKAPFEVAEQLQAIENRIPRYAQFTRDVISFAIHSNKGASYRPVQADVARVAFALKDYQKQHGEYPATLDGLSPDPIPALPLAPETGNPCVYRSDGKTFTIVIPGLRTHSDYVSWKSSK